MAFAFGQQAILGNAGIEIVAAGDDDQCDPAARQLFQRVQKCQPFRFVDACKVEQGFETVDEDGKARPWPRRQGQGSFERNDDARAIGFQARAQRHRIFSREGPAVFPLQIDQGAGQRGEQRLPSLIEDVEGGAGDDGRIHAR